jgi:hypothetical protein
VRALVTRITEAGPMLRRLHVSGELHPGELEGRGYVRSGAEWILEVPRPRAGGGADPFVEEFRALQVLGYGFAEGAEWSPAELARHFAGRGLLDGGR